MNYGMPYKGSKSKIAEWLIEQLPKAKHFYDLFGGGGAMSHCAVLSGKYEVVHYNELNPLICKAFKMAVNGEFKNEKRWIGREEFKKLKDTDPYVNLCFSFGNDGKTYAYAPKNEQFKKAIHYSIMFNDHSLLSKYIDVYDLKYETENIHKRRIYLQRYLKRFKDKVKNYCNTDGGNVRNILQSLERLERLQQLESLQALQSLEITNLDYKNVQIEEDSVIYCDPPYVDTTDYKIDFNYNEFYDWCRNQKNCFISEYTMAIDFKLVAEKYKFCSFSNKNRKVTTEKLFTIN